jgi:signal transduction histidine kinase
MDDVRASPGMAVPSGERLYLGSARRARIARQAVLVGLLAAGGAVALTLSSDHLRYGWGEALFLADTIAGFAVAGAYWVVRRPASMLGAALMATSATWALVALQSADGSLAFSLGVLAEWPVTVATFFALLAFPSGRLTGLLDRAAVLLVGAVGAVLILLSVLVSPVAAGGQPPAECTAACPPNALQVGSISPAALADVDRAASVGAALAGALLCVELVRRIRAGTRPRRRALLWIGLVGIPYATLYALRELTVFAVDAPAEVGETVRWGLAGIQLLLPWAFVASLLHSEAYAGGALERLVAGLERHPDAREWQRDVAQELDDPSLRIAVWSDGAGCYLGIHGAPTQPGDRESWSRIDDHNGAPVAAMLYDPGLNDDPELLEAAGTATLISLESGRLERDIRQARIRLLAVAEEERRRLERDLQEGAEQRLVALRVKLGLMGAAGAEEDERLIAEIGDELDATMDDLRRLAHGIYPTLLREAGVATALRAVARRSPVPATVEAVGVGRFRADVEGVLYFCCLEAMRNAATHAGPDVRVAVRIDVADGRVRFAVADTGTGLVAPLGRDGGLAAMRERLRAVDGWLAIESQPGGGTTVSGEIPIGAM